MSIKTSSRGGIETTDALLLTDLPEGIPDLGLDALLAAALAQVSQRQTLQRVHRQVSEFFGGDGQKCALWFNADNPLLGGISPLQMIRMGRLDHLALFIDESISANAAPSSLPA